MDANITMPAENPRQAIFDLSLLLLISLILVLPGALPGRTLGPLWLSERGPTLPKSLQSPLLNDAEKLRATQTVPFTQYSAQRLRQGELPLWDPYTGFGGPFLGNGRAAPFYPTVLLHFWDNPQWPWLLDHLAHFLAAAVGAWLLARRISSDLGTRHSALSTLLPPIAFLAVTAHVLAADLLQAHVVVLLPWAILALDRLIEKLSAMRLLVLIVVLALQFLGGHAAASSGLILSLLMWLAMRLFVPSGRADTGAAWASLRAMLPLVVACVIALLVAGIQWVPTIYNARNIGEDPVNAVIMATMPRASASWWTGAAVLVIAFIGGAHAPNRGRIIGLASVAVICVLLTHIPWIDQKLAEVRGPEIPASATMWQTIRLGAGAWLAQVPRAVQVTGLAPMAGLMLALLAGIGAPQFARRLAGADARLLLPALGLGAVIALAGVLAMFFLKQANLVLLLVPMLLGLGVLGSLVFRPLSAERAHLALLGVAALELMLLAIPMHLGARLEPDAVLRELTRKAREARDRVAVADTALLPGRTAIAMDVRGPGDSGTTRAQRVLAATRPADLTSARYTLHRDAGGWKVTENPASPPRYWLAPSRSALPTLDDVIKSLGLRPIDLKLPLIDNQDIRPYDAPDEVTQRLMRGGASSRFEPKVTVLTDAPEELKLQVRNPGGYLIINEAFAPGWQAFAVPGTEGQRKLERPVAVLPAYGFVRAVPLGLVSESRGPRPDRSGTDLVVSIRYEPRGAFRGMLATAAGVMLGLIVAAWPLFSVAPAVNVKPERTAHAALPLAAMAVAAAPVETPEETPQPEEFVAPISESSTVTIDVPVQPDAEPPAPVAKATQQSEPEALAPVVDEPVRQGLAAGSFPLAAAEASVDEHLLPEPGTLDSPQPELPPATLEDQASALRELAAETLPPEEPQEPPQDTLKP